MKTILFTFILQIPLVLFAQIQETTTAGLAASNEGIEIDPGTKKYVKQDVVFISSKPASQLIEGAYIWLSEIKYAHSLGSKGIEMDEAVFNRIRVKQYLLSDYNARSYKIRFILTLEFRDGRFKYKYTDFVLFEGGSKTDLEKVNVRTKERSVMLRKFVDDINASIKASMDDLTGYLNNYQYDASW